MPDIQQIPTRTFDQLAELAVLAGTDLMPVQRGVGPAQATSVTALLNYITDNIGAIQGAKGDPGGNAMSIGLFTAASVLNIPIGTDTVETSGYDAVGVGIGKLAYDVAVDAAYVAARPRSSFRSANGRGFRLVTDIATTDQFGLVGDGVETLPRVWTGTDETAGLTEVADWIVDNPGKGFVFLAGKAFLIAGRWDIEGTSRNRISGYGAKLVQTSNNHTLHATPGASGIVDFTTAPVINMIGDYYVGDREIAVDDVTGVARGDRLWIRSRQTITYTASPVRQPVAEIIVVDDVDVGTNTISLTYPLSKDYEKDLVNLDPVFGTLYPHGVVKAEGDARIVAEYLTIEGLEIIDHVGVLKWSCFLQQVFDVQLIDVRAQCGIGLVVRGAWVNIIRTHITQTATGTPTYNGDYAIAADVGSSHYTIASPHVESTNSLALIHLHEGLSDIVISDARLISAVSSPVNYSFPSGVINITGGSWNIKVIRALLVNGPSGSGANGCGGIRVSNNNALMPAGHKGLVIDTPTFMGFFAYYPLSFDAVLGDPVALHPQFIGVTSSQAHFLYSVAANLTLIEPGCDPAKISVTGANSRVYARDQAMRVADYTTSAPNGAQLVQRTTGLASPSLCWVQQADGKYCQAYMSATGILAFSSGGAPGAARGTSTLQLTPAGSLGADGRTSVSALVRGADAAGVETLKRFDWKLFENLAAGDQVLVVQP